MGWDEGRERTQRSQRGGTATEHEEDENAAKSARSARRSTGQHALRIFVPSAPFRGQEFLAKESDSDGRQRKEETVFSAFLAMPYVRVLMSREGFSGSDGRRRGGPRADALGGEHFHFPVMTRCPSAIDKV